MADNCDTGACDPPAPAPVYHQPAAVASNQSAPPHDPLNPATFVAPRISETAPSVVIEFCDRVRRTLSLLFAMDRADHPIAIMLSTSADGLSRSIILAIAWTYRPLIPRDLHRLHRATWVQTELFLTFLPPALTSISLVPLNSSETGGRFRVWLSTNADPPLLVWDRKVEGGFPELKVLKQRIRDVIQPGTSLGHSDRKGAD
ncbi:hypothetical protein FRC06_002442 [Ceratobasidium sp. 370]|nr:hypothetical protein FRC06_002442 [Ceratobasidium sp. 370]